MVTSEMPDTSIVPLSIKAIIPLIPKILGMDNESAAFDNWRQAVPQMRINQLVTEIGKLQAENAQLKSKLSEAEKFSPISAFNVALLKYAMTPLEEKVTMLRNALLNGIYGDYSVERREQLFKMIDALQPSDIHILRYLTEQCLSIIELEKIYLEKEDPDQNERYTGIVSATSLYSLYDIENPENKGKLNLNTAFSHMPIADIRLSLDRLRENGLICNPREMRFGMLTPYFQCIPTEPPRCST